MPGCNSCSMSESGQIKFRFPQEADLIIAQDDSELKALARWHNSSSGLVVLDSDQFCIPKIGYELAPIELKVDRKMKIVEAQTWH